MSAPKQAEAPSPVAIVSLPTASRGTPKALVTSMTKPGAVLAEAR